MDFIFEVYNRLPQQGPGSETSTMRALSKIPLPEHPKILDIGCGTGYQTLTLAKNLTAQITAVDIHQPYLDILFHLNYHLKPKGKISTVRQDMEKLNFSPNEFDLIWSEGAIYLMGFEKGLKSWQRFIKPGGFIAVTEVSWFKDSPPKRLRDFWESEYPAIKSVSENLEIISKINLKLIDHFSLPDSDWWEEFYRPLEKRIEYLKQEYSSDLEILELLKQTSQEIELHREFSEYYGYEFYIMQKTV